MKTFIIAEAGVNHNGDITLARKLIDVAARSGADAIKFQTFSADRLVCHWTPKAGYQKDCSDCCESQYEMLKKLELDEDMHRNLIKHCQSEGITFLSTAFDLQSIELLETLGLDIYKIPSGEITNLPYLRKIGHLKKKIIMSTGMADMGEIERALTILNESGTPRTDITVLHCNTDYPTPYRDVNLKAMLTIRDTFGVHVGYSDHTIGIEVPIAAVSLGASVIEKHFTLDKNMPGPDHPASLDPDELKQMVEAVRNIEAALGSGIKAPSPSEMKNKDVVRKSIVASRDIKKGEVLTGEAITAKRPGTGISPMEWDRVIGNRAVKDFEEDALIEL